MFTLSFFLASVARRRGSDGVRRCPLGWEPLLFQWDTGWWTRQVDIRTLARIPLEVALCDSGPLLVYQRIAPAAAQIHAAGRSVSAIARHLEVDHHTAAKALRWFRQG